MKTLNHLSISQSLSIYPLVYASIFLSLYLSVCLWMSPSILLINLKVKIYSLSLDQLCTSLVKTIVIYINMNFSYIVFQVLYINMEIAVHIFWYLNSNLWIEIENFSTQFWMEHNPCWQTEALCMSFPCLYKWILMQIKVRFVKIAEYDYCVDTWLKKQPKKSLLLPGK